MSPLKVEAAESILILSAGLAENQCVHAVLKAAKLIGNQ